jgi:hypothetical protein
MNSVEKPMKRFQSLLIIAAALVPAIKAAPSTSWDNMLLGSTVDGQATVVTKDGKQHKSQGVYFTPTEAILRGGESILRKDVKEVVIRQKWDECCESLWFGAGLVGFGVLALGSDDLFLPGIAAIIVGLPVAAVTLPPALLIQAFRHWTTHVSYKVVP